MSSNIVIPTTRSSSAKRAAVGSSDSSYSISPQTPDSKSPSASQSPQTAKGSHQRRPSLLSSAFSKDESTVINIGDPDGPPRLISYLASSQGFAWNPEIFLPSYVDCDYVPLENRRDPVHEILVTDEEIKNMLP